jgi:hypothetical protein
MPTTLGAGQVGYIGNSKRRLTEVYVGTTQGAVLDARGITSSPEDFLGVGESWKCRRG